MKTACIAIALLLLCLPAAAQDSNLTDSCIDNFESGVDYFPHKAEILDAALLTVTYHDFYKVARVDEAFAGAQPFEYVLALCGAPHPPADNFADNAQFIDVPVDEIVSLSTTQLPALSMLGMIDQLVAVDSGFYISTQEVRDKIAAGDISEIGFGAEINIELALELDPDLALTYGFNPDTDAHPVLLEAGIATALDASWRELSPLGRAEWLKFPALFANQEARANEVYATIRAEYDSVRELAADVAQADKPRVLLNTFLAYADAWHIPGADTYVGRLMNDAGADLPLSKPGSTVSQPYSSETVYEYALDADIWLLETFGVSTSGDLLAIDSRFADFAPFQSGDVWNNNLDENENGGNNYYEWGVTNPQLVLADLVAIFHPQLLPAHEFAFYRRIGES